MNDGRMNSWIVTIIFEENRRRCLQQRGVCVCVHLCVCLCEYLCVCVSMIRKKKNSHKVKRMDIMTEE